MRLTIAVIAAAIATHYLHSLLVGIIIGALVWGTRQAAPTKRVMVEDLQTGKVRIMPGDARTRRFLNSVDKDK